MPDAVAALRSMGRRWADLFEDVPAEALARPGPSGPPPLELADLARREVGQAGAQMRAALEGVGGEPVADEAGAAPSSGAEAAAAVARAAEGVAEAAAGARAEQFERAGADGRDAGWLLRHAAHRASHRLREAERVLAGP